MLNTIIQTARQSQTPHIVTDGSRSIVFANDAFSDLCGYPIEELMGQNPGRLLQGEQTNPDTVGMIRGQLRRSIPFEFAIENYHRDGSFYYAGVKVIPFLSGPSSAHFFVAIERKLRQLEEPITSCPDFRDAAAKLYRLFS